MPYHLRIRGNFNEENTFTPGNVYEMAFQMKPHNADVKHV